MIFLKPSPAKSATPNLSKCALKCGLALGVCFFFAPRVALAQQEEFRSEASVQEPIPSEAPPPPRVVSDVVPPSSVPPPLPQQEKIAASNIKALPLDKIPRILPLITFFNSVEGEVYNWWAENQIFSKPPSEDNPLPVPSATTMLSLSKKVMTELVHDGNKNWHYGVTAAAVKNLPESYKHTALTQEEMRKMAHDLGARIVVNGDVSFTKSPIIEEGYRMKVRLAAFKADDGVVLGEVLRITDLQPWEFDKIFFKEGSLKEIFADLHEQIASATIKAQLKPHYVRLLISGALTQAQLEIIKQKIQRTVKGVRAIQPGAYENEQVALMIDYQGESPLQFGQALRQVQFGTFLTQVVSSDANQVLFDVQARQR